jgi:hypothetical protein
MEKKCQMQSLDELEPKQKVRLTKETLRILLETALAAALRDDPEQDSSDKNCVKPI